jgi:formylglycine-generating enzyme required for sulfatase activity
VYSCPGYRLPTAAEYEYAARAGTTTDTYNGDIMSDEIEDCAPDPVVDEIAWSCSNATQVMPVGLKKKNQWGLYDILGNAGEWSSDPALNQPYGGDSEHIVDPHGWEETSLYRPIRGAVFHADPVCVYGAKYFSDRATMRIDYAGFRPVRTLLE